MARSKSSKAPTANSIEPALARTPPLHARAEVDRGREGTLALFAEPASALDAQRAQHAAGSPRTSGPQNTTTVPEAIRERFMQVGEKWFFPNGDPAFKDHGHKLTTGSENAEVVRSLIDIAKARGWEEITVVGSKEFKRAAWHEASLQKIAVRGYTPTEIDEARLVRTVARQREAGREPPESEAHAPVAPATQAPRRGEDRAAPAGPDAEGRKRILYGTLLAHGAENYRLDPNEDISYFVRLKTDRGRETTLWGKDLERALRESKSQPQIGDRIGVVQAGQAPVTVPKKELDGSGRVLREYDLHTHRNEWTVESEAFFKERARLAELVRDSRSDARSVVQTSPELSGTFVALQAAKLLAQRRFADQHDQARFVETIRQALAREIRRGEPLYAPELRDRARDARAAPAKAHEAPLVPQ